MYELPRDLDAIGADRLVGAASRTAARVGCRGLKSDLHLPTSQVPT